MVDHPPAPHATSSDAPPPHRWRERQRQAAARASAALDLVSGPVPTLIAAWLAAMLLAGLQSGQVAVLIGLGFCGALVAGMVGIGGGIVMIPVLLYVPPLLGAPALSIHTVSGITIVQIMAAAITGMLAHRRGGHVAPVLVMTLGLATMLGSLTGGVTSRFVSANALTGLFASLAALAAGLLLVGPRRRLVEEPEELRFSRVNAVMLGSVNGFLTGMVGAGGGFMLVPTMIYLLKIPVRVAVGSTLGIVTLSATAAMIGKAVTGQVDWLLALALVCGALPGAYLGALTSRRISAVALARLLAMVIGVIAAKMWWDILGG